ncbi:hypothetical protein AB0333_04355 [Citricoccus sp. NPDC079358]|uniref:hypothetical protein n=1 Tax=Citricoccus sp. NPDC079358 TaxID=3154653 RepID=UPI00344FB091
MKAAALAAGRPEPAWDENCVAWELPDAETDAQQFASTVARTWLDAHGADCPDALVWPHYYAETFSAGGPGEVVVVLEDEALADYYVDPYTDRNLQLFGFSVFDATRAENPDLEAVTVTVEGTDRTWTATTAQHDTGDTTAPPPPHMRSHMPER